MSSRRALILLTTLPLFAGSTLDWIDGLGGKIDRDAAGEVIGLRLRGSWITDTELLDVARLPKLERLDLSHTRITDDGLLVRCSWAGGAGRCCALRGIDTGPEDRAGAL